MAILPRGFLAKETGMSSDGSARQSHKHTSLYASVITKKNKNKKQGVGYSEVIFASVFVNFDLLSRIDSHWRESVMVDTGLEANISFFKKNTNKYLGLLDFIILTRSLFTCVQEKKVSKSVKIKRKDETFKELFSNEWKCRVYLLNIMMVAFLIKTISW